MGTAVLFGASTPLAKLLLGQMHPVTLAAVLYFGSGIGLLAGWALHRTWSAVPPWHEAGLDRHDIPWLAGAIVMGGVIGPVLLMVGLTLTPASSASLLLNLEGVLTAVLAWFVFHEHFGRNIVWGMVPHHPWRNGVVLGREPHLYPSGGTLRGRRRLSLLGRR
ncbi:MAG: hypothetical protein USCGTAYLOR_00942 [Chromatiales bacterium USCg_Taylor]|nr:MAG: hypothetical protein USCGTAYLOR_00942 [Chromatiales bacterium USCg_Taylor]